VALNSPLLVRRLLIGGSPVQDRYPASEVNDGTVHKNQSTSIKLNLIPSHIIELAPFLAAKNSVINLFLPA
jgi:hypothetical protein